MSAIRVLIVDDEPEFTAALSKVLRHRGLDVGVRPDGPSGLEAFASEHWDVVLLDVKMPGMDGLTVLEVMHKMNPKVPVILLTGHMGTADREEGLRRGAFVYLLKPCSPDDLYRTILEATGQEEKDHV